MNSVSTLLEEITCNFLELLLRTSVLTQNEHASAQPLCSGLYLPRHERSESWRKQLQKLAQSNSYSFTDVLIRHSCKTQTCQTCLCQAKIRSSKDKEGSRGSFKRDFNFKR